MSKIIYIRDHKLGEVKTVTGTRTGAELLGLAHTTFWRMLKHPNTVLWNKRYQISTNNSIFPKPTSDLTCRRNTLTMYYVIDAFTGEVYGELTRVEARDCLGVGHHKFTTMRSEEPGYYVTMNGHTLRDSHKPIGPLKKYDPYIGMLNLYPGLRIVVRYGIGEPVLYTGIKTAARENNTTYDVINKVLNTPNKVDGYLYQDYRRYGHIHGTPMHGRFLDGVAKSGAANV